MRRDSCFSILAFALLFTLASCGGSPTGPGTPPSPTPQDPLVDIAPGAATLQAIGATRDFEAGVVDEDGNSRPDGDATWLSTNAAVATVDAQGVATAQEPGSTQIVATFRGVADTADLTVDPAVAEVTVTPERDTVASSGGTTALEASAEDGNGHPVGDVTVAWSSSDPAVATVDTAGRVTGEASGEADIVASAGGESDTARIVVTSDPSNQPPSVTIEEPGDGATFSSDATITFEGSASDPEDGSLSGDDLRWQSDVDGEFGTGSTAQTSSLSTGDHQITLTATDSDGASSSAALSLTVEGMANLVLSDVRLVRRGVLTSESPEVSAVIRNDGSEAAGEFSWRVLLDGATVVQGQEPGLAARDSVLLPVQSLGSVSQGYHWVDVEADDTDEVSETDEGDNLGSDRLRAYPSGDGFDIELDYLASVSEDHKQAFENAAARWSEVVIADLPDITFSSPESFEFCTDSAGQRSDPIDDLLIFVTVDSIDGQGGKLGQASPCLARTDPETGGFRTAAAGQMTFDEADLNTLSQEMLEDLMLHEMGHVLGIGSLWNAHNLREDAATDDPIFTGAAGRRGFDAVGGDDYSGRAVPLENTGDAGTRDAHWRESVFENELMTGFISSGSNPLSRVTVQSLGDQFYAVSLGAADSYSLPSGSALRLGGSDRLELGDDIASGPLLGVTRDGRVLRPAPEGRVDRRRR